MLAKKGWGGKQPSLPMGRQVKPSLTAARKAWDTLQRASWIVCSSRNPSHGLVQVWLKTRHCQGKG